MSSLNKKIIKAQKSIAHNKKLAKFASALKALGEKQTAHQIIVSARKVEVPNPIKRNLDYETNELEENE